MAIKHWPSEQQPREKLLAQGPTRLSDAELLAIFLRTGIKGKSAVCMGKELIEEFAGFRGLLAAEQQVLQAIPGLGIAKIVQIRAILEIARRYLGECLQRGRALSSAEDTRHYLLMKMRDTPYEVFSCLFLDNQHRIIAFEEMFRGTIDNASVYPREIVKRALDLNAAALILAHNHPSGNSKPSAADKRITRRIVSALDLVDIRVLDHFIIGDSDCTSFAEMGLL